MGSEGTLIKLGDLVAHKKGFAFKSVDYQSTGIPVVRVSNFTDNSSNPNDLKFVSEEVASKNSEVALTENDIVVATVGSWPTNPASVVGRTISVPAWASGALMNQNSVTLRARSKNQVDQRFLYFCMKSADFATHVVSKAQGSANQASITLDAIFSFPVWWPDSAVRQDIVAVLDSLDSRINLLRETNATLEAIAQALFKSWFVDFDPVRAKMEGRLPEGMDETTAALFPDGLEESELGTVPIGWAVGVLGDILKLRNERVQPSENTALLPYVPIENINAKFPFLQEFKSGQDANSSLTLFYKGDVLFGAMRPYFHKVCSAPFDGVTRTTVFTLTPMNPNVGVFALFQAYQDSTIQYATQHSEGSTIPYAKWRNSMELMPLFIPAEPIQMAFSSVVSSFVECANSNILQAQNLAALRDTLLPRLISGQLRLTEVEARIDAISA